jgi:hypothetical protein
LIDTLGLGVEAAWLVAMVTTYDELQACRSRIAFFVTQVGGSVDTTGQVNQITQHRKITKMVGHEPGKIQRVAAAAVTFSAAQR